MDKNGKFWGTTSTLFNKNNVEVHRIEAVAGGWSSEHEHKAKYNMFFVESGRLKIFTWKDAKQPDETVLSAGDSCVVPPGLYHKFEALTDCVAYEIYWVELDPHDITRRSKGGG